ncbi:(4Fe-4S)-binding protein [Platysternon megacephalum]|uniref:(4Fe-4S)-binding protein n=1 Tax=Platysternon megacephalum TaxID=55544 RepID=A0A4D9DJ29_9SAUR|nr:(4Fe-4S)-binding protein [Platysternon megacephalum]
MVSKQVGLRCQGCNSPQFIQRKEKHNHSPFHRGLWPIHSRRRKAEAPGKEPRTASVKEMEQAAPNPSSTMQVESFGTGLREPECKLATPLHAPHQPGARGPK